MTRPRTTGLVFLVVMVALLGAMAWVTATALTLDRTEREAREAAATEESIRLALWRMDSALTPLIAEENTRPYFEYTAFYPTERAYTNMYAELTKGDVLVPSPLLTFRSPFIRLHFQIAPDGTLTSPQVPAGNMRDLAESGYAEHEDLETLKNLLDAFSTRVGVASIQRHLQQYEGVTHYAALKDVDDEKSPPAKSKLGKGRSEFNIRQKQVAMQKITSINRAEAFDNEQQMAANTIIMENIDSAGIESVVSNEFFESALSNEVMNAYWVHNELLLARRMAINGDEYIQGCWMQRHTVERWLLGEISDLLPEARLEPATNPDKDDQSRMLAAIPVQLVPGTLASPPTHGFSPIRFALLIAWACVLFAVAAVATLLWGAVSLSERRGAFVSAVTHELRTPLTTFRMYTEMLADKRVTDPDKQQQYLDTLARESNRLGHLVENVLSYARLERGRTGSHSENLGVVQLLERMKERLAVHCQHAGMRFEMNVSEELDGTTIKTNAAAVEQILMNLVDNACKYAAAATDKRVTLEADRTDGSAVLRIRDSGPGISQDDKRRLFKPFTKSARDAAHSAPGIGLGLALSRRLARTLGGDLTLADSQNTGCTFELRLPLM